MAVENMDLIMIPLIGTYERKLDTKNRFHLPKDWFDSIKDYENFLLYQPSGVGFISVISQSHFERNKSKLLEILSSPLWCTSDNVDKFISEISSRYGPLPTKINTEARFLRLAIPKYAPFLKEIREDRKITMVGGIDYFSLFHGTIESVLQRS